VPIGLTAGCGTLAEPTTLDALPCSPYCQRPDLTAGTERKERMSSTSSWQQQQQQQQVEASAAIARAGEGDAAVQREEAMQ